MISRINEIIDSYRDEIVGNLQKLLRIPSVAGKADGLYPFGEGPWKSLEFMLKLGEEKGFECRNFHNYAGDISFGSEDCVGIISHVDVVPEGDGWSVDPYGGEIVDGKIYGRGAIDNKGCAIAALYAAIAVRDSGLNLKKGIRQIIGTFEEGGDFPCIKHYLKQTNMPDMGIVPDSWFPAVYAEKSFCSYMFHREFSELDEDGACKAPETDIKKGLELLSVQGGSAVNTVPSSAKAVFKVNRESGEMERLKKTIELKTNAEIKFDDSIVEVSMRGRAAHASKPELGLNAISELLKLLEGIDYYPKSTANTLRKISHMMAYDLNGKNMAIDYVDNTGKLTNNLGIINYANCKLEISMNIRCPVTISREQLEEALVNNAESAGMHYSLLNYNPHFYVEPYNELLQKLMRVYGEMSGKDNLQAIAHGAGSYARILKNFIPFGPWESSEETNIHKADENIRIEKLIELTKIYAQALYAISKGE